MIDGKLFGCDVSGWQPAGLVPWTDERIDFGLVKFSEGDGAASSAAAHVAKIRQAGKVLGAYHFFHPEVDSKVQFDTFDELASKVGYGHAGDMVPAVDVEYFRGHGVTKAWDTPLRTLCDMFEQGYQALPILYLNHSTWQCLGSPAWMLQYPLWVPYYMAEGFKPPTACPKSAVPGWGATNWTIWQFMAGKVFGNVQHQAGGVDQNFATRLPLIGDSP